MGPAAVPDGAPFEPLLANWPEDEKAWYERHSTVPINHLLTVRTDVLREDPESVRAVYDAFAAEIDRSAAGSAAGPRRISHGLNDGLLGSVELAIRYARQQHLIAEPTTADEVFADFRQYLDAR
jgi:4,5-dihydroxyphthalate decarboxylase